MQRSLTFVRGLVIACCLSCVPCYGETVLGYSPDSNQVAISPSDARRWQLDDKACVVHELDTFCGTVTKVGARGAIIKLTDAIKGAAPQKGDAVQCVGCENPAVPAPQTAQNTQVTSLPFRRSSDFHRRKDAPLWLDHIRAMGILGLQSGGGSCGSGQLSWNPEIALSKQLWLRGNLGATWFRSAYTGERYVAPEYGLLLAFPIEGGTFEAGGGAQTWLSNGGTSALLGFNVLVDLDPKSIFRYAVMGYSLFFLPGIKTHQLKLGVEMIF